jgi:hypothetical protein
MHRSKRDRIVDQHHRYDVLQANVRQLALIGVETKRQDFRWQFVRGVGKLAVQFGITLSDEELQDAWTLRSKLAHGQSFLYGLHEVLAPDKHRPLYDKLESLLRAVVKKCLLDEEFGERFASKEAVAKYYI